MKRQDHPLVSSSSYRENIAPETLHAKSIGCMSGLIKLVCRYPNRHKFLTFGKKQEKNVVSSATKPTSSSISTQGFPPVLQGKNRRGGEGTAIDLRRFPCDMQRSPTLPAEIRHSHALSSTQHCLTPPALVARLMGLESMPESAADKRRKLLGALEKCDEDLKALKKIIEAVQLSERQKPTATGIEGEISVVKRCSGFYGEQQQPSPVSVLDELNRPPSSAGFSHSRRHINGRVQQQQRQLRKKPGEEEMSKVYLHERMTAESVQKRGVSEGSWPPWSSKAMIETLDQVCGDIAWGERREIGRIGLALQDHICRDLIEEIVREMGYYGMYSLPFETCKRRLCF